MKAPKIGKVKYDGGTSAGGFLTRDNTLHFEGKGVAGAKITIFSDGVQIGKAKVDKKGNWSFDSKALPDGAHSFTAKAKLGKDASPASKALAGEIDATAPPAPGKPDLATASDTGSSSTDDITPDTTPTLTGTAEAGATVTIKDGATVLGTAVANGAGQWSFTTGVLSNAAHSLTATATDKAGNVGAASASLVVTVDTSASAPLITGFADDTGGAGDRVTLDTTLLITGTAEAGATVQIFDGLVSLGPATANGAGVWSFPTAVLAAGHHSFTASQTDAAGNVSAVSAAHTVRVGYDIDTATMTPSEGFRIFGADAGDSAGYSVSSAGDINGDGFDDMIVGARNGDGAANGKSNAGEAIVVFGKATGFADVDVTTMTAAQGFRIFGADADDSAGYSVSSAGDINGDGFDDLLVGAPFGDGAANGKSNAGEAIVIYGGNLTGSVVHAGTSGANTLTGTSAAETFVAGQGADTMTGNGGADSFHGGAGNDTITVPDLLFRHVDGGSGTDTLVFSGTAQTIDFTTIANNKVTGIEAMNVTGSGADTIVIGALDVLHFSDTPHAGFTAAASHTRLVVMGDAGDTLDLRDYAPGSGGDYTWVNAGEDQSLSGGAGGFDFYNLMRNGKVLASIAVDADMSIL